MSCCESSETVGIGDSCFIETPKYNSKVVILGESSVGKTSLLMRHHTNTFTEDGEKATIGCGAIVQKIENGPLSHTITFWDTAGQEIYNSITKTFARGSNLAIVAFALNDRISYARIPHWLSQLDADIPHVILVGTKSDCRDLKWKDLTDDILREHPGLQYYETSAKTGQGVEELFTRVVSCCV